MAGSEVRSALRGNQRVVIKRATGRAAVDRLSNEATLLRRATVPGVITYVSYEPLDPIDAIDDEPAAELVTIAAGDETLASMPPADERGAAAIVASLAAAVADLHSIGIAHRTLRLEHVIIGADRKAVLCGFGDATAVLDPALFLADTEDLGALIGALIAPPGTRDRSAAALDELAQAAGRGELTPRAIAQEAARIAAADRRPRRRAFTPSTAKALVAVSACGVAVALLTAGRSGGTTTSATNDAAPPSQPASEAPWVERDGLRYTIGMPGDVALIGAWSCGPERIALLRPSTGEIFVFDRWATPAEPLSVSPLTRVAGGRELAEAAADGGCARLYVRTATTQVEILTKG